MYNKSKFHIKVARVLEMKKKKKERKEKKPHLSKFPTAPNPGAPDLRTTSALFWSEKR